VSSSRGFSLVEVLVATTILVIGVAALAQLFVLAISANARARTATVAVLLAQQKVEQLEAAGDGLTGSPPDALTRNASGFWDSTGGFLRRWSVEPLPEDSERTFVVQVVVSRARVEARLVAIAARPVP
jgi:prepilin-type N-terminal cleavage/methylation domain-containing protein